MNFAKSYVEYISIALEVAGVSVIVIGAIWSSFKAVFGVLRSGMPNEKIYQAYRKALGEGILLGLEFLVAADIIKSVAVKPTFTSVGVLSIIVLVRTFLSFTLEVEMRGKWPWQVKPEENR